MVRNLPPPRNRKGVLKLTGLFNFFGKFIPGMQNVMVPISELRSVKKKFVWGLEQQKTLDELRHLFEEHVILKVPDLSKRFVVHVDGSGNWIAWCLSQEDDTGELRPVAFYSKNLTEADKRRLL